MFLLATMSHPISINIKCDPEKAVELREEYEAVTPGYHMNKQHWNTVMLENSIPDKILFSWIDDSYNLIFEGLPKKDKKIITRK